jgi:outer membrane protein assembly factor BamB
MNNRFKTPVLCIAMTTLLTAACPAVTSVITRHKSGDAMMKGTTENTVVDSRGIIQLSPKTEKLNLEKELDDVWIIHAILADKTGTLYIGTSPRGKVIRVRDGKTDILYPKPEEKTEQPDTDDPNTLQQEAQPNEHVFALAFDVAGRILAGVSGDKGRLLRISSGTEVIFENEKVRYIFAIVLDKQNNIYVATGPNGQLWGLDAFGQNPRLICTLEDKNILSLSMGENGMIYAGTDTRGVIYKIDSKTGKVNVLFDSGQEEITSLVQGDEGKLFAAASSAEASDQPFQVVVPVKRPTGRPDAPSEGSSAAGGQSIKTANSDEEKAPPRSQAKPSIKMPAPKSIGYVYEITGEGFVKSIFDEKAIFYTLFDKSGKLLLGTGPQAKLFSIDPQTEERTLIYEDKTSSQITAAAFDGKDVYVAMANPAAIVCLKDAFAGRGTYLSDLIDAGQPARWGKIQLDADIPDGCEILVATRSGNIGEPNDATFSSWSQDVKITEPVNSDCPVGRFCQYRLTLKTKNPDATPQVREISVAQALPNLEPKVLAVAIQKSEKLKPFGLIVMAKAEDDNKDTLEYAIEYRKLGRQGWILLKDKLEQAKQEWDSRTVEDGRYEVRVTANDRLSNSEQTALSNSRISDPIVIDNTAPVIVKCDNKVENDTVDLELMVEDEFSIIGKVQYTVDSDSEWKSVMPVDGMLDSTREKFAFSIKELGKGEHVIALRIADDIDNTAYKSYVVNIE